MNSIFKIQVFCLATLAMALLIGSCKTVPETSGLKSEGAKIVQCHPGGAFKGICKVLDVAGRLGVTTEAARASFAGEISEVHFNVPLGDKDAHASAQFFRKSGLIDDLVVNDAMDLYGRLGCLAEINGGVVGEGFTPRVTLHSLFNVQDQARSGYAEISDYRTGKPLYATLSLKCDWQ